MDLEQAQPLQLASLRVDPATRLCQRHSFAVGIRYPDGAAGTLICLKPSLTGDEELDVVQYSREYPAFPHEEDANVVRPLEQLESYRQLGEHIGMELFAGLAQDLWTRDEITGADLAHWLTGKEGVLRRATPTVKSVVEKEVSQQLERIVSGPPLQNYEGHLCALFTDEAGTPLAKNRQGLQNAEPGQACRLKVWLQLKPPDSNAVSKEVAIRNGVNVTDVVFEVIPDSDRVSLADGSRRLVVSPEHASTEVRFNFKAPGDEDICPVWVQLMQQNRLTQVLKANLAVGNAIALQGKEGA